MRPVRFSLVRCLMETVAGIFAENLRRVRNRCAISQKTLADRSGLSASFISHMEMGRKPPNLEAIVKMARAMNVPVRALVEDLDPPEVASAPAVDAPRPPESEDAKRMSRNEETLKKIIELFRSLDFSS